ncbi:hypothetical protein [Streptosporangium sp. KLBMP 9127]|nr:hypothetical protein [Streptosporangium sp. KLBMP 9127]
MKIVHFRPTTDSVVHEESADCVCGPQGDIVGTRTTPHPAGVIYHHHALHHCAEWEVSEAN